MGNLYFDTIWATPISKIWSRIKALKEERKAAEQSIIDRVPFQFGDTSGVRRSYLDYAILAVEKIYERHRHAGLPADKNGYQLLVKHRPVAWYFEATGWYIPQFTSEAINRKREIRQLVRFFRANGVEYTLGTPFYDSKKIRK